MYRVIALDKKGANIDVIHECEDRAEALSVFANTDPEEYRASLFSGGLIEVYEVDDLNNPMPIDEWIQKEIP